MSGARTRRRIASALLLFGLIAAGLLALWGTSWSLRRATTGASARYVFVGAWDAADAPRGGFQRPIGIAVAPGGDVLVTDARVRVVRLSASGRFQAEWGGPGDGLGDFANPVGVAVGPDGSIFVSDYEQDRVQKFTADGRFLASFGMSGKRTGQLDAPAGLATDAKGSVYVADFYNSRVQQFRPDGSFQRTIGHPGRLGPGALHYPTGVSIGTDGELLVADAYNYQLQWFDPQGRSQRRAGYHLLWLWPRPAGSRAGLNVPTGATAGPDGLIHVADSGNHRVVMLSQRSEYLTQWAIPEADPRINSPEQIAVSPDGGTVYATDFAGNRVIVLRVSHQHP